MCGARWRRVWPALLTPLASGATDTTREMHVRLVDAPPALEVRQDNVVLLTVPLGALIDSATAIQRRGTPGGMPATALTYAWSEGEKAAPKVDLR